MFSKEFIKDKNNKNKDLYNIIENNHLFAYFSSRDIRSWNNFESELEKIVNGIIRTFDDNPIINKPLLSITGLSKPRVIVYDEIKKNTDRIRNNSIEFL